MAKIHGKVMNFEGRFLKEAEVTFIDRAFNVISTGYSDTDGYYYLQPEEKTNGMVYATSSYGKSLLGFWFHNLNSDKHRELDIVIGEIELLEFNKLMDRDRKNVMITFQPLSLTALKDGMESLSPDRYRLELEVKIDGRIQDGYELEVIREKRLDKEINQYNIRLNVEGIYNPREESLVEIQLYDELTGEKGMAKVLL
jgi:hypothetical protein